MKYEEMKVKELRSISKERGLTLEHKGHKFTKSELIERLTQSDDIQSDINKAIDEAGENKEAKEVVKEEVADDNEQWDAPLLKENRIEKKEIEKQEVNDGYIKVAQTVEQFEKKYGSKKKDYVYNDVLTIGSFVAFIEYVTARNGEIYKKLRTAKVIKLSRSREVVRVEKPFGEVVDLDFNQLLYITGEDRRFPLDIRLFLYRQKEQNRERRLKYECNKLNRHFN